MLGLMLIGSVLTTGMHVVLRPPAFRSAALYMTDVSVKANSWAGPTENDTCYLFETYDGVKYVCTSEPEELAFMLGLDEKDLIKGVKPDDLTLVECAEDWSHTGTPQWVCKGALRPQEGSAVDMEAIGWEERTWAKRSESQLSDDGACFIVSEDEAPDPNKQWFFCNEPSDDQEVECELVPEWMGSAPDGGHAVWMCSKEKPS